MAGQSETFCNQPLRFSIPTRDARGRLVRLDEVLAEILAAHAYPPIIEKTLAEALVLTALLGASLKEKGSQLTLQTQTEKGAIRLLACDYKDGALRGYAQFDPATVAALPDDSTLLGIFGRGYLAIIKLSITSCICKFILCNICLAKQQPRDDDVAHCHKCTRCIETYLVDLLCIFL